MALFESLSGLLSKRKFGKITVNDICEKSLMSRATFYAHFNDKYDLLRWWLTVWKPPIEHIKNNCIEFDNTINAFIEQNKSIITNLLEEANSETFELLIEFISSLMSEFIGNDNRDNSSQFSVALDNFCAGGVISLVLWQIGSKTPLGLKMTNVRYYKILDAVRRLENGNTDAGE